MLPIFAGDDYRNLSDPMENEFDGPQRLNIFSFKNKRSHYTSIYGYKYNVIIGLL